MATYRRPELLLLDEHTAALDPRSAEQVIRLTDQVIRRDQLTTLMVTHSMAQAASLGDRLIMAHQGRLDLRRLGRRQASPPPARPAREVRGAPPVRPARRECRATAPRALCLSRTAHRGVPAGARQRLIMDLMFGWPAGRAFLRDPSLDTTTSRPEGAEHISPVQRPGELVNPREKALKGATTGGPWLPLWRPFRGRPRGGRPVPMASHWAGLCGPLRGRDRSGPAGLEPGGVRREVSFVARVLILGGTHC